MKIIKSTYNHLLIPVANYFDPVTKILQCNYLCSEAVLDSFKISPDISVVWMKRVRMFPYCLLLAVNNSLMIGCLTLSI